jgi:predicted metal-dependent phosphoesterase TrpH
LIDLHTHTNESDGTCTPEELIRHAAAINLEGLAITDHDTLKGYNAAVPLAAEAGLDLVCGIELSTKLKGRSVHLLGYFPPDGPSQDFREWIRLMQESRRDRNVRLAARLASLGVPVSLPEVEAKGRGMTGRPHFAQVMVEKGYVTNVRQAFDDYLDESAKGYVERMEPKLDEGIGRIRSGGGIAVLPHPVRAGTEEKLERLLPWLCEMGLEGIEVYHSDHGPAEEQYFLALARRFGLLVTGGSDFHGDLKPGIALGTGPGNLRIPRRVLEDLRERMASRARV